jgi:hypothetical protein
MMRLERNREETRRALLLVPIHVKPHWHQCTNAWSADAGTTSAGGIKHLQIAQAYPR